MVAKLIRREAVLGVEVLEAILEGLAGLVHLTPRMLPEVSSTNTMSRGTWYSLRQLDLAARSAA